MLLESAIEKRRKEIDELYEKDIVYRVLVDNYIKSSNENLSKNLNALATYENALVDKNRLEIIKKINFTDEDIAEFFKQGIFDYKTVDKMIKIKFKHNGE